MRVSISIAAYNAEKYLAETLQSVLDQSYTDWELLVVDDGSRDRTPAIVEEFAARDGRIRLMRQENAGAAVTRNRGLRAACPDAEFAIMLDHDDTWTPDALERLVGALDADLEAVGAHGIALYVDAKGEPLWPEEDTVSAYRRFQAEGKRLVRQPANVPTTFAMLLPWCCIPTPGLVLIRRSALEQVGLFDESNPRVLDWDMWIKLARIGNLVCVPHVLLHYRQHSESAAFQTKWLHTAIYEARRRFWNDPANTPEQQALVRASYRPTERYFIAEKLEYIRHHARRGEFRIAARQLLYALRHCIRYMQGRP